MNQERIFTVLKGPHVSEKATVVADQNNQYVFKVASDATKPEIKAAVEALFEVSVTKVILQGRPSAQCVAWASVTIRAKLM